MEKKIKQALIKLGWVNPVGLTINLRDDELTIRCMVDGVREIKQSKQPSNCDLPQAIKPVCPICHGKGEYSYGGSFGGATHTVKCNCGANSL